MALLVIPQRNQPQGLAMLGGTIANAGNDYETQKRRTDFENRQRQRDLEDVAANRGNQLADVAANRTYQESQFDKLRGLQLTDEQRKRGEGMEDLKAKSAFENRLRNLQEAEARGIFDAKLIGNVAAEDEALAKLQIVRADEAKFSQEQAPAAKARLDQLTEAEAAITQKMAAVEARLSAEPTIDRAAVLRMADQIATAQNGGKMPTQAQREAALPVAMEKAQGDANMRWYQDKQDASVQYQILSSQLNTIRQQQANITSTFKVAPSLRQLAPPPAAAPVAPPPSAGGNTLESFKAMLEAEAQKKQGQNPPPPAAAAASPGFLTEAGRMLALAEPTAGPITGPKVGPAERFISWIGAGANPQRSMAALQTAPAAPQEKTNGMTRLLQRDAALGFPGSQPVGPYSPGFLSSDGY